MQLLRIAVLICAALPLLSLGEVTYQESVDEFTGENNSLVMITGVNEESLVVMWRCLSGRLVTALGHNFMGGDRDDDVAVRFKFDDDEPSGTKFYRLMKSNNLTMFDRSDVKWFTKDSIAAQQVMIRVTDPMDNDTVTESFFTDGLEAALQNLPCYP